jgi:hypothetical protein
VLVVPSKSIKDGLYLVAASPSGSVIDDRNGRLHVYFDSENLATVSSLRYFEQWHELTIVSSDKSEALNLAFGNATPAAPERGLWSLTSTKDGIWYYVGTEKGLKQIKTDKVHTIGRYKLELP